MTQCRHNGVTRSSGFGYSGCLHVVRVTVSHSCDYSVWKLDALKAELQKRKVKVAVKKAELVEEVILLERVRGNPNVANIVAYCPTEKSIMMEYVYFDFHCLGWPTRERASEQFLNGTSAQYRLYSAIQIEIIKKNKLEIRLLAKKRNQL